MAEAWMIASAHGGEGKTTVTALLGKALANRGYSVALVDLNVGYGELDMALGLQDSVVYNLIDAVNGLCRLSQALMRDPAFPKLYLLAAPANEDSIPFKKDGFASMLASLQARFDYVLMDAPPGCSDIFRCAAGHADRVILLCEHGRPLRGARHMLGRLFMSGAGRVGVVLNKAKKGRGGRYVFDDVQLEADLLCAIPYDPPPHKRYGETGRVAATAIDLLSDVMLGKEAPRAIVRSAREDMIRRFQDWLDGAE